VFWLEEYKGSWAQEIAKSNVKSNNFAIKAAFDFAFLIIIQAVFYPKTSIEIPGNTAKPG